MTREIVRQLGPGFFMYFDRKNCHSSKSVSSIDLGPIFLPRLNQELSRNAFVASILFPEFPQEYSFWYDPGDSKNTRIFGRF